MVKVLKKNDKSQLFLSEFHTEMHGFYSLYNFRYFNWSLIMLKLISNTIYLNEYICKKKKKSLNTN